MKPNAWAVPGTYRTDRKPRSIAVRILVILCRGRRRRPYQLDDADSRSNNRCRVLTGRSLALCRLVEIERQMRLPLMVRFVPGQDLEPRLVSPRRLLVRLLGQVGFCQLRNVIEHRGPALVQVAANL